jgi:hypothetical protein
MATISGDLLLQAEEALTAATAMRQKEKADFAQSSQEQKATIVRGLRGAAWRSMAQPPC